MKALMGLVATHVFTKIYQEDSNDNPHHSDQETMPLEAGIEVAEVEVPKPTPSAPVHPAHLFRLAQKIRMFWTAFWSS